MLAKEYYFVVLTIHYKFYSLYILLFGFKEKIHANGEINMIKF